MSEIAKRLRTAWGGDRDVHALMTEAASALDAAEAAIQALLTDTPSCRTETLAAVNDALAKIRGK